MANYAEIKAIHQTLSGTTQDSVRIGASSVNTPIDSQQTWDGIEVSNRSGASDIYFTINGLVNITAGLAGTEVVGPGATKLIKPCPERLESTTTFKHLVRLVGNGNEYSVVGVAG